MGDNKTKMQRDDNEKDLNLILEQALEEKNKGNAAYQSKNYATALTHYNKAIELDPTNIIFWNNKGAVYFEQRNFEECIKTCEKAVEVGRENQADFKFMGKAFGRIGNAYYRLNDLENALDYLNKSMLERRDPDVESKILEIKRKIKEPESDSAKEVRKYIEEGAAFMANKEPTKAAEAYQKALNIDRNNAEALDGHKKALMAESEEPEAVKRKAMSNPKVQKIINDPTMQLILGKMSTDPKEARELLKQSDNSEAIKKLMEMIVQV